MLRRLRAAAEREVLHAIAHPSRLQTVQGFLKVLHIPLGLADLRLEPGVDGDIAGRLPHAIVALQERFLSLNLAMDVLYGRIVVHLGGGDMCWGEIRLRTQKWNDYTNAVEL
jgi:hypothetical protein